MLGEETRMLGEQTRMQRLYIEPSDESVEKLSKTEMVDVLMAKIASTTHGVERESVIFLKMASLVYIFNFRRL